MDNAELALLARGKPNPFTGSVLRNGFEPPTYDVPEIHAAQRATLRALIDEVRGSRQLALQVITGEPGDGKTHLLASLRAEAEASWRLAGKEHALVPIEPLRDPDAPFVHILQGLVRGLRRNFAETEELHSPLEHILWKILGEAARAEPSARYPSASALLLREEWPGLEKALRDRPPPDADHDVWSVLCGFPREPALIVRWLSGSSLPEEELARIGAAHPLDSEDRAFRALSTLLHLSPVPIVLAFDQLEGVTRLGDGAVARFLQAIGDQLYTSGGCGAVLIFCQLQAWKDFEQALQVQTRDRFEQRAPVHLGSVEPALGEKLIAQRLLAMWRGEGIVPPHPTFPYDEGFVRRTLAANNLRGPRSILSYFARLGFETAQPPPLPALPPKQVAIAEYEKLRAQPSGERDAEKSASIAQAALRTILKDTKLVGRTAIVGARSTLNGLEVKLAREGRETTVYAEASNARHGMAARSVARRLGESLKTSQRAVLIRDAAIPLPPLATRMIGELGANAAIVRTSERDIDDCDAVERLLNGVKSKDIDVPMEAAIAAVAEEIAPRLEIVRRFLDAALQPAAKADEQPRESIVLAALGRPPFVAVEAQLASAHGVPVEQIAAASDALEARGSATVLRGKDGARTVMRRPK